MSRLSKVLAALVAVFSTASLDARDRGYLAFIGPAPLRFAMVKPPKPRPIEQVTLPDAAKASIPSTQPEGSTNSVNTAQNPLVLTASETLITTNAGSIERPQFIPADNMLSVTPSMLNELFKPADGATNQPGATMNSPSGMNFQPPGPNEPPVSRASYKSE